MIDPFRFDCYLTLVHGNVLAMSPLTTERNSCIYFLARRETRHIVTNCYHLTGTIPTQYQWKPILPTLGSSKLTEQRRTIARSHSSINTIN